MASIPAFNAEDQGSIPRPGVFFWYVQKKNLENGFACLVILSSEKILYTDIT